MIPRLSHFSLHARLLVGMGAMLLPLLALALGAFYAERVVTGALDKVISETLGEMNIIMHLQKEILSAGVSAHDALSHHTSEHYAAFNEKTGHVEDAIVEARAAPFGKTREWPLVQDAIREWRQAQQIILKMTALTNADDGARNDAYIHRFRDHIERAVALLDEADELSHAEIDNSRVVAGQVRRSMEILVAGVFATGLLIVLVAGMALTRTLIRPLRILEDGARRFGEGQLAHRVTLDTHDEAGRLAEAFNTMADQIEHNQAALAELAVRDSLTGLYNRREFERRLHEEIERALRYKRPLALLMLDIDHFKQINDSYGHQAGDEALRAVATYLTGAVRPADQVARYGGEEFVVLLPETEAHSAFTMAERLCELTGTHSILLSQGRQVTLTVSIGMAVCPDNAYSSGELIAAADQAMYAAKAAGRNRVVRQTRLVTPVAASLVMPHQGLG